MQDVDESIARYSTAMPLRLSWVFVESSLLGLFFLLLGIATICAENTLELARGGRLDARARKRSRVSRCRVSVSSGSGCVIALVIC